MKKRIISFQEEKAIIDQVEKIAVNRGSCRSAIIRECIRKTILPMENDEGGDYQCLRAKEQIHSKKS